MYHVLRNHLISKAPHAEFPRRVVFLAHSLQLISDRSKLLAQIKLGLNVFQDWVSVVKEGTTATRPPCTAVRVQRCEVLLRLLSSSIILTGRPRGCSLGQPSVHSTQRSITVSTSVDIRPQTPVELRSPVGWSAAGASAKAASGGPPGAMPLVLAPAPESAAAAAKSCAASCTRWSLSLLIPDGQSCCCNY